MTETTTTQQTQLGPGEGETTTTVTKVRDNEEDYKVVMRNAGKWGRGMLGIAIGTFLLALGILVVVIVIVTATNPIPDTTVRNFEWRQQLGGEYNKMVNGSMTFALWRDGTAAVINTTTGQRVNPQADSSTITSEGGLGGADYMIFTDGQLFLYRDGAGSRPLAVAGAVSGGTGPWTLNLMPDSSLFVRDNAGINTPIVWHIPPPPT